MDPWVCVATYNERDNVRELIDSIRKAIPLCHIVVVDDGSPDGTGKILDELARTESHLHPIHREGKLGYASAHRAAIACALRQGADTIITMDADFSHDPKYLPALLQGLETGADLAIGSRYVPGGGVENWPWTRYVLSSVANTAARIGLGLKIRDCTGGFRAYRASLLEQLRYDEWGSEGYCFLEEMLLGCTLAGAATTEVPIVFVERRAGQSKMSRRILTEGISTLLRLSWRRLAARRALMQSMLVSP